MWFANSFFAPHSQIGVNAMPNLRIVAQKRPTPIFSRLSLAQGSLESAVPKD